jgi:hypothetical protein
MEEPMLPKFDYYLDESDPDIAILRRSDGSFVAAFSARGATKEGIVEAAKEDYGGSIRAQAGNFVHLRQASKALEEAAAKREVRGSSRRSSSQNTPSTHSSGE